MIPIPPNTKTDRSYYEMFHRAGERLEKTIYYIPEPELRKGLLHTLDAFFQQIWEALEELAEPAAEYEAPEASPIRQTRDIITEVDEHQLDDQGEEIVREPAVSFADLMKWQVR